MRCRVALSPLIPPLLSPFALFGFLGYDERFGFSADGLPRGVGAHALGIYGKRYERTHTHTHTLTRARGSCCREGAGGGPRAAGRTARATTRGGKASVSSSGGIIVLHKWNRVGRPAGPLGGSLRPSNPPSPRPPDNNRITYVYRPRRWH